MFCVYQSNMFLCQCVCVCVCVCYLSVRVFWVSVECYLSIRVFWVSVNCVLCVFYSTAMYVGLNV